MKKSIYSALILIVLCIGCKKESDNNGHVCRWGLCPYKGISIEQYKVKAEEIEGSDGYYLDLLHLQHPSYEYDQLEDMLFKK